MLVSGTRSVLKTASQERNSPSPIKFQNRSYNAVGSRSLARHADMNLVTFANRKPSSSDGGFERGFLSLEPKAQATRH